MRPAALLDQKAPSGVVVGSVRPLHTMCAPSADHRIQWLAVTGRAAS